MIRGERFNSISHLVGAALAAGGAATLITRTAIDGDATRIVAASVFGAMLVLMYTVSTLYHALQGRAKPVMMKLDRCAIYLLIAGTYTPYALSVLGGAVGWTLFGVIWGLALVGVLRETWWARRAPQAWLPLYVTMGWLCLGAIVPLVEALDEVALALLAAGGIAYTVGIVFFVNDTRWRHAHGIWHLFVLAGSTAHFLSVARALSA